MCCRRRVTVVIVWRIMATRDGSPTCRFLSPHYVYYERGRGEGEEGRGREEGEGRGRRGREEGEEGRGRERTGGRKEEEEKKVEKPISTSGSRGPRPMGKSSSSGTLLSRDCSAAFHENPAKCRQKVNEYSRELCVCACSFLFYFILSREYVLFFFVVLFVLLFLLFTKEIVAKTCCLRLGLFFGFAGLLQGFAPKLHAEQTTGVGPNNNIQHLHRESM